MTPIWPRPWPKRPAQSSVEFEKCEMTTIIAAKPLNPSSALYRVGPVALVDNSTCRQCNGIA